MKDSLAVLAIFTFKGTPFEREMRFLKERSSILEDEFLLPCGTVEGRNRCELRPVITVKVDIESTGYVCRGTNILGDMTISPRCHPSWLSLGVARLLRDQP